MIKKINNKLYELDERIKYTEEQQQFLLSLFKENKFFNVNEETVWASEEDYWIVEKYKLLNKYEELEKEMKNIIYEMVGDIADRFVIERYEGVDPSSEGYDHMCEMAWKEKKYELFNLTEKEIIKKFKEVFELNHKRLPF